MFYKTSVPSFFISVHKCDIGVVNRLEKNLRKFRTEFHKCKYQEHLICHKQINNSIERTIWELKHYKKVLRRTARFTIYPAAFCIVCLTGVNNGTAFGGIVISDKGKMVQIYGQIIFL